MTMPEGLPVIDTMIGFPPRDMKATSTPSSPSRPRTPSRRTTSSSRSSTCSRTSRQGKLSETADPVAVHPRADGPVGRGQGHDRRAADGGEGSHGEAALKRYPDRFIPSTGVDPNDGMEGIRELVREYETYGVRAVGMFPAGHVPAGRHQRQEDVSDVRQVRRARHPGVPLHRRARATPTDGAAARRAARRGLLRLPGAHLRDPSRLRAVDRSRRAS